MIIRWPGHIPESRFIDALHTPMDIFPTLCGLTDVRIPNEVNGLDMSDIVLGNEYAQREHVLMANYTSHWNFLQSGTLWPEWRGVFTGRYTYVKWLTGEEELYDNAVDPYQMNNLLDDLDHSMLAKTFRQRLKALLKEADDDFRPGNEYGPWFTHDRRLVKTGLGPVPTL